MSHDGLAEQAAIFEHLKTLAGGRVEEGWPDDAMHARYTEDDTVKPYLTVEYFDPFPTEGDATMTDGAADVPYVMPFTVASTAGTRRHAVDLAAAARRRLIGFEPNGVLAGEVKGNGGSTSLPDRTARPSRFQVVSHFHVTINL
ncbi:hypothetical protein [Agromyces sp. NPDC058104]|uniref:hypothetical protein n=1 Tax=Agromyces sp. NPDC058104 TaxID=3346342 RepID=UPI0036D83059